MNIAALTSAACRQARRLTSVLALLAAAGALATCRGDETGPAVAPSQDRAAASPIARLRSSWNELLSPFKQREAVRMFAAIFEGFEVYVRLMRPAPRKADLVPRHVPQGS